MAVSATPKARRRRSGLCALLACAALAAVVLHPTGHGGVAFSPARRSRNGVGVTSSAAQQVAMSLGIPKVAYRVPGAQNAEWIDIYSRLYRERIIFLGREIDDEVANQIIGVLLYLDAEDSSKPIYLYINSVGGSVVSGLAIYDTMQHIASPVVTINIGLAASMASFLLASGAPGRRLALPSSRVMIHQVMGAAEGQAADIRVEAQQILQVHKNLVQMYATMTGKDAKTIRADLMRDNFMSAHEAKAYGLVDEVIELDGSTSLLGTASKALSDSVSRASNLQAREGPSNDRDDSQPDAGM